LRLLLHLAPITTPRSSFSSKKEAKAISRRTMMPEETQGLDDHHLDDDGDVNWVGRNHRKTNDSPADRTCSFREAAAAVERQKLLSDARLFSLN
jgi:hypothetical protein